jgi:DNA processing protein
MNLPLLKLSILYRPGSNRLTELLESFGNDAKALADLTIRDPRNPKLRLNLQEKTHAGLYSDEKLEKITEKCNRNNIKIIDFDDENYPKNLREIYNPPIILYVKGDETALNDGLSLAVVGARDPSAYSIGITKKLIRGLQKSEVKWTIVSGLARGIDITAHIAAMKYGAKTVAVKGCGILYDYPKQNEIYFDLIAENGAIISEYPPEEPAKSSYFPVRNRIIAGMSAGTLVIEASEKSGSISTANLAAEFGRDVFAIPPNDISNPRYFGNVSLLRDGVTPIYGLRDLIFENVNTTLFLAEKFTEDGETPRPAVPVKSKFSKSQNAKSSIPKTKKFTENSSTDNDFLTDEPYDPSGIATLQGNARTVAEMIIRNADKFTAEDITNKLELDVFEIMDILTELELDGYITRNADATYGGC